MQCTFPFTDFGMTTADAIESMTDAGSFEILATRVLRQIDPDYARIEHLGVNANGKTVKNPLDGFSRVPGITPSRYVMAGFSTDHADKILKKLLFDHTRSSGKSYKPSDDGDLIKAARLASALRGHEPDATFVFTFCTNKQPRAEIMQEAYEAGAQYGVEVRFLARSHFRDHLDTTPQGQWLRLEHLGISADLLSLSLLRALATANLSSYSFELFCSTNTIIGSATTTRLRTHSLSSWASLIILNGASGSGKSVACYHMLSEVLSKNGIGLWLPAETAATSLSLDEALTKLLQSMAPSLSSDAGRLAQALAAQHNVPLVIAVDDVNRTTAPLQCVRKLISWMRKAMADESLSRHTHQEAKAPHLVLPIWNHLWSSIAAQYRSDSFISEFSTQPLTADEAHTCLQAYSQHPIGRQASFDLTRRLEFDPILIGLWGTLYGHSPSDNLDAEPHTLIEAYIVQTINDCAAEGAHLPGDFQSALTTIASRMITERDLYPQWTTLAQWLDQTQLAAIRQLCVRGGLCRVVNRDEDSRFTFRHDRLLETVIAKSLAECLRDIERHYDILADPYFTASVARVLVSKTDVSIVPRLTECAPLAVLRSLRHVADSNSVFAKQLVQCGKHWLSSAVADENVPSQVIYAAAEILRAVRSHLVLEVTEFNKEDHRFSGARLVNGDAEWGKYFVANRDFYPSIHAPYVEDTIAEAKRSHCSSLCAKLAADLNRGQLSERELHAAFVLAGYLGEPSLAVPVLRAWEHHKVADCLVEALWASIRCSVEPEETLEPLLESWASLSDDADEHGASQRTRFLTELKWSMRHGVSHGVVIYFVSKAISDGRLSWCLTQLLGEIDHPAAVAFVASEIAQMERKEKGANTFNFWVHQQRSQWDPLQHKGKQLSNESRAAILSRWKEATNESEQNSLLCSWVATTVSVDELLQLPAELLESKTVLWRRARLGDRSCIESLLDALLKDKYWWTIVPNVWDDRMFGALDAALAELSLMTPADFSGGNLDEHYIFSSVLRCIPREVAVTLLHKHWTSLKCSRQLFQTALYFGDRLLGSACEKAFVEAPSEWKPFEHLGHAFGFSSQGLKEQITFEQIDSLIPYVSHLPDAGLMDIAEWLAAHNGSKVLDKVVLNEIKIRVEAQRSQGNESYIVRLQRIHFPTDDDLVETLDGAESDNGVIWRWCHYATARGESRERLRVAVRKWFMANPTPDRLNAVAKIVVECGDRTDVLDLLDYQREFGNDATDIKVEGAAFAVRYRTLS